MGACDVQIITVDDPTRRRKATPHYRSWDTLAGDETGWCPTCMPGMVGSVRFHSHMIVTSRVCPYCWARFAPAKPTDTHCSSACKARTTAWDAWIRETGPATAGKGPKAPRGGGSLAASTERFVLTLEAVA